MPLKRKSVRDRQGHYRRVPYTKRMIDNLSYEDPVLFGLAKGPWALEWANRQEEKGQSFSGQDVYAEAPNPPSDAVDWAEDIASQLKRNNNVGSLLDLYGIAQQAGFTKTPEEFGVLLGCQAAGHGIAWDDDLSGAGNLISVPRREFYI